MADPSFSSLLDTAAVLAVLAVLALLALLLGPPWRAPSRRSLSILPHSYPRYPLDVEGWSPHGLTLRTPFLPHFLGLRSLPGVDRPAQRYFSATLLSYLSRERARERNWRNERVAPRRVASPRHGWRGWMRRRGATRELKRSGEFEGVKKRDTKADGG